MEEAAQADYITIIDHGEVLAKGTPLELKNRYASDMLKITPVRDADLTAVLNEQGVTFDRDAGGVHRIPLNRTVEALGIIDRCRDNIANVEIINGTMDDVFINLTGTEVRS